MEERMSETFLPLPLEVQADFLMEVGLETLLFCPDPWALQHRFVNRKTGEVIRARCGSWSCLYCGPRKVDMWRQLVKAAEPTLFVTLTKVGWTLKEAARTLTTVLQYLRRGSKGRGKNRIGARPAYSVQVFAVLEEHSDFAENGFHWHLLVKGVDFLPQEVIREALCSATGGRSYIVWVKRVKNNTAVGYVTKYLMKEIQRERRGLIEETHTIQRVAVDPMEGCVDAQGKQYAFETRYNGDGSPVMEEEQRIVQRLCKAHRIRYSKQFFPASTAVLRQQLFGEKASQESEEQHEHSAEDKASNEYDEEQTEEQKSRSAWMLYKVESPVREEKEEGRDRVYVAVAEKQLERLGRESDFEMDETRAQRYRRMHREALIEALERQREGKRLYSRRIIGIWSYQRERLRMAG